METYSTDYSNLPIITKNHKSESSLVLETGKASSLSNASSACTSPLGKPSLRSQQSSSTVSPFSIYNGLETVQESHEWEAMEQRIFSFLDQHNVKALDIKDELRQEFTMKSSVI